MIIAEELRCVASTEYAKSALDFFCTVSTRPEVWTAAGTWGGVTVAFIAGYYARKAWRTAMGQLKVSKDAFEHEVEWRLRGELRQATARMIRLTHVLIDQGDNADLTPEGFRRHRRNLYEESLVFELSADVGDPERFNALINWVMKSAGMRHAHFQEGRKHAVGSWFGLRLLRIFIVELQRFVRADGNYPLTDRLTERFVNTFNSPMYRSDELVKRLAEMYPLTR